jgi:hypothetical protein
MAFAKKKKEEIDNTVYHGRVEKNGYSTLDFDIEKAQKREPYSIVRFQNLDNKRVNIPFTKNIARKNEKGDLVRDRKGNVVFDTERYNLEPGKLYCLPNRIINDLLKLTYPLYEDEMDPETKQMRSVVVGYQPRFALTPHKLDTDLPGSDEGRAKASARKEREAQA